MTTEKWVKVAAVVILAILVIWLISHNSVVNLHDQEPTMPADSDTRSTDGYELYRRAAYDQALEQLLPLADHGDEQAQCLVGKILTQGLGGVVADRIEGIKWLDLCLRNPDYEGDDEARDLVDNIINTAGWDIVGEGKYRAFQWQEADINTQNGEPGSASEFVLRDLGTMDGDAAFTLGADLNNGTNLPVDYTKALDCFRRAAEFNIPEAAFNIGISYYAGKGVKAEPTEARRWLQIAADGGFAKAATLLGIMSARGHGTGQDIAASLAYLAQAAKLGDPEAAIIKEAIAQGSIPR